MALTSMTAADALQDFIGAVERAHHDAPWTGEVMAHEPRATVEGEKCPMQPGDLVLTPSWTWQAHANAGDEPAILFSIQDIPGFEALGRYPQEAYADNGGHQLVTSVFEG